MTAAVSAAAPAYESPTRYEDARIHAAALYCSDGRYGDQIDEFLHNGLSLPRYDRLACPGGPIALAGRLQTFWETRGAEDQIRFLLHAHDLRHVVLVAHAGCGYYRLRLQMPVALVESEQLADLRKAASTVARMDATLQVRAFFARVVDARVRFESVAL